jgi:hypothetical protein
MRFRSTPRSFEQWRGCVGTNFFIAELDEQSSVVELLHDRADWPAPLRRIARGALAVFQ